MIEFVSNHILSVLIFFPLAAALFLALLPKEEKKFLFYGAIAFSVVEFVLSLHLWCHFKNTGTFEFMEVIPWIKTWNVQYLVGIDGVSLWLVLLTTLLVPLALLGSLTSVKDRVKEFTIAVLCLEAFMIGVFCALDLFLFYVLWEVMLVPMYLLIGVWGGNRRIYAAIKFFIYTMAGSVFMLAAIIFIYFQGGNTFNLVDLYDLTLTAKAQLWLFLAFAFAFAIKVPLFPFHTWLPDAHVEAPTAGSVILAGVLLKMGTYGFFRFAMPLFPEAFIVCQPYLIGLSLIGIVYGALVALVQTDIKKLIAYSSVSHLGVVMLGVFSLNPTGMVGGLYQMINHGVSTGALFLLVGVLYERTHSRAIAEHGGLAKEMPWYTVIFLFVTFSSIGLPLTNGFIGEFLTIGGTFQANVMAGIIATTGVVLSAGYMLWLCERVLFGKLKNPTGHPLKDMNLRELLIFVPLLILILWMGIYPKPFLNFLERPVEQVLIQMESRQ